MRAKMQHRDLDLESVLDKSIEIFDRMDTFDFTEEAVTGALAQLSQQGFHGASLLTPLRYALTGCKVGFSSSNDCCSDAERPH